MTTELSGTQVEVRPKRGRALAEWRRSRAIELALAGRSYDDIAAEVGYTNRGTAWNVVSEALRRQTVEGVENYRGLELARLETILGAHWAAATSGQDLKAADLCIKLIAQRAKMLGIDGPPPPEETRPRSIIISAEPGQYARDLQAIVEADQK